MERYIIMFSVLWRYFFAENERKNKKYSVYHSSDNHRNIIN